MKEKKIKRLFEILPGLMSWFIILFLFALLFINPLVLAVILIIYLIYWACKLFYMTLLLLIAHHRMSSSRNIEWFERCRSIKSDIGINDILHIVLYPIYKEPKKLLQDSMNALKDTRYSRDKMILVLAGEERDENSHSKLGEIKEEFKGYFKDMLITIHPKDVEGEIPSKGANATYAAKKVKDYLELNGYDLKNVIISTFDADTCPDKNYFCCLTYHFLSNKKRYQTSFQPLPIYNNNIYRVPAFARVIEIGSTFCQLVESMRYEKFITFSSHSMSFKTLVDVDYWPVNLISDDSLIFWKCFLKFNGDYMTYPLEVPVYMDIAVGRNVFHTIAVQYKQKRRWAWGVENFAFVGINFINNKNIKLSVKIKRLFQLLDSHVSWATWAFIISFITPFVLFWGKVTMKNALVFFNLSYINGTIFNIFTFIIILSVILSRQFLPPRPKDVSPLIYITFILQWLFIPIISAFLGSTPALDAQTRLMFGNYLSFYRTPKARNN